MKNVTITVEEEVARWARVAAAEREMSLSRFIGEILKERMGEEDRYRQAMDRNLPREPVRMGGGPYPGHEGLHER